MTDKSTRRFPAVRSRSSLPLTGTQVKAQASLDLTSALAIEYAQEWHRRHKSPAVPLSGVVRRALQVYAQHLQKADAGQEVRAMAWACKVFNRDPADLVDALLRLHGADPAAPLPTLEEIRDGRQAVAERAAMFARLDATFDRLAPLAPNA